MSNVHTAAVIHWITPDTRIRRWKLELDCGHVQYRDGQFGEPYPELGEAVQCSDQSPAPSYGCPECRFGRAYMPADHNLTHMYGPQMAVMFTGVDGWRELRGGVWRDTIPGGTRR